VRRKRLGLSMLALSASICLVIAGCSSGGDTAEGSSGTSAPAHDLIVQGLQRFPTLLAEAKAGKPASGTPIQVGFVTMESGNYVYKTMGDSAANAVRFINSIGGVKGHPLELIRCGTNGSPESSQNCATQMVNSKVVAVGQGIDFGINTVLKALAGVGGSGFGGNPLFDVDREAPNGNYYLSSWADQITEAEYAVKTLGVKKVAILSDSDPVALGFAKMRAQAPLTALGVRSDIFSAPSTTTDYTSLATKARGYDAVLSNAGGLACSGIPLALQSTGFTGPVLLPDGCNDKASLDAMGSAGDGAYFGVEAFSPFSDFKTEPAYAKPEVDMYVSVSKSGAPNLAVGGHEQLGFAQMINFAEALSASSATTFDPASVTAILRTSKGAAFTQGTYDCAKSRIAKYPAFCTLDGGVYQWDGKAMTLKTSGLTVPTTITKSG
jgi:branched-chain amino acid transport system substrate-binding protein